MKRNTILLILTLGPAIFTTSRCYAKAWESYSEGGIISFAEYSKLTNSPRRTRPLGKHNEFVFAMYGCPDQLKPLKELVRVIQEKGLGNGYPGKQYCHFL